MRTGNQTKIIIAKILSWLFNPMIIPFFAFSILLTLTYLSILPGQFKFILLNLIFSFTLLIPLISFSLLKRTVRRNLSSQDRAISPDTIRTIQYIFSLVAYIFCMILMRKIQMPWFMNAIIVIGIIIQLVLLLLNVRWHLSMHSAAQGAIAGAIISFSTLFLFNPLNGFCLSLFIGGSIATSRMILGRHTLTETLAGWLIGFTSAMLVLHPYTNYMFRYLLY